MRIVDDVWADMAAIMDGAEGRNLTEDEVTRYGELERELAATEATNNLRQRHAAYNTTVVPAGTPRPSPAPAETIDDAFRAFLRTGRNNADLAQLSAAAHGLDVSNAQGTQHGPAGGYLVPEGFRNKLVDRMKRFGGLANVVEEITTSTGENLVWPTVDDTNNEGEIVDEGDTFSGGSDLDFGDENLGAYQYMAGGKGSTPIRLSLRLTRDSAIDIERLVSGKLGQRLARIQSRHWVRGTGVKQPQGIIMGRTGIMPADDTDGITYRDMLKFIHAVDPDYRDAARWAFNDASLEYIRGIEDNNGRPILKGANDGASGSPGGETLLGYPVTIDQAFPDIDIDNKDVNWGVFGDLREGYVIRRVRDILIVVNPWTRAQYGEIEYSAIAWADAVQQDTNAYVALSGESA